MVSNVPEIVQMNLVSKRFLALSTTILVMLRVSEAGRMIAEGLLIIVIVAAYQLKGEQ